MLVLNGTDQYAHYTDPTPSQGIDNFARLPHVTGQPLWMVCDVLTSDNSAFILTLTNLDSTINWVAGAISGANVQTNHSNNAIASKGFTAGVMNRFLFTFASRTSRFATVNGVDGTENTTSITWPTNMNRFLIGGLQLNGAPLIFLAGSVANVAIGCAPLTQAQRAAFGVTGVNPLSMPGVIRYWPLETDASEYFSAWPLTLVNSPSFTSVGHPSVSTWPPVAGAPRAPSLQGGLIT